MRLLRWTCVASLMILWGGILLAAHSAHAQAIDGFAWVDLRRDAHTVQTVTEALADEKYTAVREIGYVGVAGAEPQVLTDAVDEKDRKSAAVPVLPVPPDAHLLVITATRSGPAALPQDDSYTIYDVDAKRRSAVALLSGTELRLAGWLRMRMDGEPELVATYADCTECQKTTFLSTLYLDGKTHTWQVRWPRSRAGAPIYSEGQETNGGQQMYALLDDEAGRVVLGTWQHFSGRKRRDSDFVYEYRVDGASGQEVTQPLSGSEARALETRLCHGQGVVLGIGGGQESAICRTGGSGSPPSRPSTTSSRARRK